MTFSAQQWWLEAMPGIWLFL